MTKYAGIIILNYRNFEDTINCIKSVEKYNSYPIKYLIIDNASPNPSSVSELDNYFCNNYSSDYIRLDADDRPPKSLPKLTFLCLHKNMGYASGNNAGLELTYCDPDISYIMILNNDVLFVEDIIPQLIQKYVTIPDAGLLSPVLYKRNLEGIDYNCARRDTSAFKEICSNFLMFIPGFNRKIILSSRYYLEDKGEIPDVLRIQLPSGSCMLADKSIFKLIGGFDPNTFLYWEENILFKKLSDIGKCNYLCSKLKCIHLGAASTSTSLISKKMESINLDSELYYFKTYTDISRFQYYILLFSIKIRKIESIIISFFLNK